MTTTARKSTVETKNVKLYSWEDTADHAVTPEVGSVVNLDGPRHGEELLEGDAWSVSGYDGCDFRFPCNPAGPIKSVACNVVVTGRVCQKAFGVDGGLWIRCKVEFVGDCEPSTFASGWMLVKSAWK